MGLANQSSQQAFPASVSDLYETAIIVLPRLGFELVSADPHIWRIRAKASLSALSWGENIALSFAATGDEARQREMRRTAWKLPEEPAPAPARGPKRVAGYNYHGAPIDEFEDGTYVLHLGRGPQRFATKDDLNDFLRRNF
jgi:hypothetical protein